MLQPAGTPLGKVEVLLFLLWAGVAVADDDAIGEDARYVELCVELDELHVVFDTWGKPCPGGGGIALGTGA